MYQLKERKNKNNIFVRDCITTALFELLKKKNFVDISVSQIIEKAGVSRMGFYRNFESKESVVQEYVLGIFIETVNQIKSTRDLNFTFKQILITTLQNFKRHAETLELFLHQGLEQLLFECYHTAYFLLKNQKPRNATEKYADEMFVGEIFNLEMTWIKTGMKESPQKLVNMYHKIHAMRVAK